MYYANQWTLFILQRKLICELYYISVYFFLIKKKRGFKCYAVISRTVLGFSLPCDYNSLWVWSGRKHRTFSHVFRWNSLAEERGSISLLLLVDSRFSRLDCSLSLDFICICGFSHQTHCLGGSGSGSGKVAVCHWHRNPSLFHSSLVLPNLSFREEQCVEYGGIPTMEHQDGLFYAQLFQERNWLRARFFFKHVLTLMWANCPT